VPLSRNIRPAGALSLFLSLSLSLSLSLYLSLSHSLKYVYFSSPLHSFSIIIARGVSGNLHRHVPEVFALITYILFFCFIFFHSSEGSDFSMRFRSEEHTS